MNRNQAKAAGLIYYDAQRPCVRSHLGKRLVSNRNCVECEHVRPPVTGRLSTRESPDRLKGTDPEQTLYAIMKADAAIWRTRRPVDDDRRIGGAFEAEEVVAASGQ
jgi:hypothetical protein